MFTMMPKILILVVVLFAGAVVSIYDPDHHEPRKSYRRDPHIARQLQRHRPSSHRFNNQPRLSDVPYQQSANVEQQERHANPARPGWDYANNIDQHYEGCPKGFTGLQAYPYDCRRFVNCWKGRAYIQSCGPGTVFNDRTLECDNPTKVVCRGLNAKDVQGASSNRVGRLQSARNEVSCPTGFTGLQPHPHECSKFLNCANGAVYVMTCGPQTMFNPKINACDFAHKVDCSGRSGAGSAPLPSHGVAGGNRGGKTFEIEGNENQAMDRGRPHRKGWSHNNGIHRHNHSHHHGPPHHGPPHHFPQHHGPPHLGPPHHGPPHPSFQPRPLPTTTPVPPTSTSTIEPFPILHRDRWSNMNRARPSAFLNTTAATTDRSRTKTSQQSPPSRWTTTPRPTPSTYDSHGSSGIGTSTARTPSNYPNTYDVGRTDATITTNIYYAQPVDEDTPSEEIFSQVYGADVQEISLPSSRRNGSRGAHLPSISRSDPPPPQRQPTDPIPIPNPNLMPPPPDDDGQSPISEEYPDFDFHQGPPSRDVSPFSDDRQSIVPDSGISSPYPDQYPDYSFPKPSFTTPSFAPKGDDRLRPHAKPSPPSSDEWQSEIPDPYPSFSSPYPSFSAPKPRPPPQSSFSPADGSLDPYHVVPDESNLWGGMLPPPPPPQSAEPANSRPVPSPALPSESYPEPYPAPAPRDESNLWGGMLPPPIPSQEPVESEYAPLPPPCVATPSYQPAGVKTNVRVVQTFPPPAVQNAITRVHASPLYSPSYAGISHSRDGKVLGSAPSRTTPAPRNPVTTTTTQRSFEPEIIFSRDEGVLLPLPQSQMHPQPGTTTRHHGVLPPNYNREFYKQTTPMQPEQRSSEEEGIDDVGQLPISEAIRLLLRPYFNRSGTVTDDVASEAESHIMSLARPKEPTSTRRSTTTTTSTTSTTTTTTTVAPPAHKDVELVFSGEQDSLSRSHAHPSPSPHAHPPSKYHYHHHSRDFHRAHPHLGNPFEEESREHERNDRGSTDPEIDPHVEDVCEFDCGNGKCIKALEVCDGVLQCDNRRDEEKCDHLGYAIRLSNGDSGRVEVKIFGQWGYVCDDKFGIEDANVVCRELGYPLGASEVRGNSFYAPDEGRNVTFVMDDLDCKGTEKSLRECPFQGWGVSDCGRDEVVGVQCKTAAMKCPNNYWLCKTSSECIPIDFVCDNVPDCSDKSDESGPVCNSTVQYRLKGGKSKQEGRLEVLYRSVWGTVCDDDFSQNEAQVACNSLGYYGKAKIVKNAFGPVSGPIWLDQISCIGNESAIDSCTHWAWGEHNCNHTEDVSLKCSTGSAPSPPKADHRSSGEVQTQMFDDIGIDFELLERSSKFKNNRKICGHFNANLTEPAPLEYERVVRGNLAKRGHHPWQATIRTKGQGGISSHWCGAVLISKKHLLTAAHCLVGYPKGAYFIRLGDHIANIAESSEIDSYIEDWYVHEKFRDGTHMNNDIAMIVLKNPVRFNDYIQPICLPPEGSKYEEGRLCTISGWGSIQSGVSTPSNNLRAAQIPVMSDDTCKLPHVYGNLITDGMFCAGYLDEGVDACEGDSGGPFVCSDSGTETLYGIISWGKQCGHSNKPGVYVRIEKYIDWIYGKIRLSMQQTK